MVTVKLFELITVCPLVITVNFIIPGFKKGAIGQLIKDFVNEWAAKGVNVNAIAPRYISTDNTTALRADENRSRSIMERIPAGRWGNLKISKVLWFFWPQRDLLTCMVP